MTSIGKVYWAALLVNLFAVSSAMAAVSHPNILLNSEELAAIRSKVAAGVQPWKDAYDRMISQANAALALPNMSVTFGGSNSCGANNIFCTGEFYAGGSDRYDWENGAKPIGIGVRDLGMAYAFTGDARYADKLIQLVRVWAIDPVTGMQPVFGNSQARMDLYGTMTGLIYGVDLAWNYPGWNQEDKDAFMAWVQAFGENAMAFSPSPNNFENWRNAFVSIAGAFTGDQALLNFAFQSFRDAIPNQIHWTGRMNQEYERTNGWGGLGYSLYAIHAMLLAAEVARHHGVDLYNYNYTYTVNGETYRKGLKVALDFHAPYARDPSSWPYGVGTQSVGALSGVGIYELAYSKWQDPAYLGVINQWGRPMSMNMWALGIVTLTHGDRFDLALAPTAPNVIAHPSSVTVEEGEDALFTVVSTGSGPLSYQWLRDGRAIAGATNANFTVVSAGIADNGSVFSCEISNSLGSVTSDDAVLTVLADVNPPTLVSVVANSISDVDIVFSEAVSAGSAQDASNYTLDQGVSVSSARLDNDGYTVHLSVSPLAEDMLYTVRVSNVQDLARNPNAIDAQSSLSFTFRTADDFEDGDPDGWTPLNASNWSVVEDEGDMAYFLNNSSFSSGGGGRLGEYSLLAGSYADFTLSVQARLGDDIGRNRFADYAIVFGYQDENNYYYAMLNNEQAATQLFKVVDGNRVELATASGDWLNDNAYHRIDVRRSGSAISVDFDGTTILSASDSSLGRGQVGVGSFNDSAYFDDISVVAGEGSAGGGSAAEGNAAEGNAAEGRASGEPPDVGGGGFFSPVAALVLLLVGCQARWYPRQTAIQMEKTRHLPQRAR